MPNATFKIRKDLTSNEFIVVDYVGLCAAKGLKPLLKTPKRRVRYLASIYSYPVLSGIALKAEYTKPLDELASSKRLTAEYVKTFLKANNLKVNKDARGVAY